MAATSDTFETPPPAAAADRSSLNRKLFFVGFLFYYTDLSLTLGPLTLFPNIGTFLVGLAALWINRDLVQTQHIRAIAYLLLAVLAMLVMTSIGDSYFLKRVFSFIQFSCAFVTFYGFFILATQCGRQWLSTFFFIVLVTMLAGCFLEEIGVMRGISDAFRNLVYSQVYNSDARDIMLYGTVRPNFFGREPSLAGITTGFSMAAWLTLNDRMSVVTQCVLLIVLAPVAFYIIRSPTIAYFVMVTAIGLTMLYGKGVPIKLLRVVVGIATTAFCALFVAILGALNFVYGGVLTPILLGGSFFGRITGPALIAYTSFLQYPLFGVGIGAYDKLAATAQQIYLTYSPVSSSVYLFSTNVNMLISNAFWDYWIFFGIGGGCLCVYLLRKILLSLSLHRAAYPLLALGVTTQTFGGAATARVWYYFAIYAAIAFLIEKGNSRADEMPSSDTPINKDDPTQLQPT